MIEFEKLPFFEEYFDEKTGVKSYILTKKPADFIQSFYFTNQSLSQDQKYLWTYCLYPPLRHRCLGVVCLDVKNPFVKVFKEAVFWDATPLVAPESDKVYFVGSERVGQICTIDIDGNIEEFAVLDPSYVGEKKITRFGTHLTLSADGKYMLVDAMFTTYGFIALLDMETRKFSIINEYQGLYNHGQFSPVHPNLFLIDQDSWCDPITGKYIAFKNRIWLHDTDATIFEPVVQRSWFGHDETRFCHDFWSGDGKMCTVDFRRGAFEMDLDDRKLVHVWNEPLCHAHCNHDRSLWVADQSPYAWEKTPCRVIFFNRSTEKTVDIFSALPKPPYPRAYWHIDPHPQFASDGKYIVSTTTVRGGVDIAVTPVDQLTEMTK